MINSVPVARGSRRGTGLLPGNPKQWGCENNALDLRRELGITIGSRLSTKDAFACVPNCRVVAHGEVACAQLIVSHFRSAGARWSGLATRLDDGTELIIFNDSQAETRLRASLMEELFHLRLGHPRSLIRVLDDRFRERTLDGEVEREAFGSGAAALVPYLGLKCLVTDGAYVTDIAQRYGVSRELVEYRMKVTRLYNRRRGK